MKVIKCGQFNPELFGNGQNSEEFSVRLMRKPTLSEWIKNKGLLNSIKAYSALCEDTRPPKSIAVQLRNSFNRPLVPGSSLKGAMRTAIIRQLAGEDKKGVLGRAIEQYTRYSPDKLNFADQNVCRGLLGETPNDNLMRTLTVGDVMFEQPDINVQTISVDRMVSDQRMNSKFSISVESVRAGAKGSGQLSFDFYLQEADRQKKCFYFKMCLELSLLLEALRSQANENIEHEINFFKKLNGRACDELGAFYTKLQEKQNKLEDNQALLQLGWGSGWRSMTGPLLAQEDLKKNDFALRKNLRLAHKYFNYPFPKSRKVASNNGRFVPMGWIIITLTSMEEERCRAEEQRQETLRLERIKQAEIAAEKRRQAELEAMTEEERQLLLLERGELIEQQVVALYNLLDGMEAQIQLRTAKALKEYWQKEGKWNKKKMREKQLEKVNKVKTILGEG